MRHQHRRQGIRRRSTVVQRRSCRRTLGYLGLLAAALALPAILTLRGGGSRFVRNFSFKVPVEPGVWKGIAEDIPSSPRSAHKVPVEPGVWKGIAEDIPSSPRSAHDIHIVFSTDCSPYQNYQSILLFNSAEVVGQRGPVTRVASGCSEQERQDLRELMKGQPERFRVHFTPDYSWDVATGEQFMFYNKPNGMAHFLKYADPPVQEAVVALLDPDMILLSELTPYVGDRATMLWHDGHSAEGPDWVMEGQPVAQYYGLGGYWVGWDDLRDITKELGPNSPANEVEEREAASGYPVGPPYLLHPFDWARVIDLWVQLCPKVFRGHPSILAEMYGYCIAAAHIGLRHRVAYGMMVSDTKMEKEGWPLVDHLESSACDAVAIAESRGRLPPVLHYCQMYRVGTYMFGKRHKSHHTFFTCDADSLQMPPPGYLAGPMGKVKVHPGWTEHITAATGARLGYMMCSILRAMNMAQAAYKRRYCRPEEIHTGVRRFTDLPQAAVAQDVYGR